jgi:hypothetical protein
MIAIPKPLGGLKNLIFHLTDITFSHSILVTNDLKHDSHQNPGLIKS